MVGGGCGFAPLLSMLRQMASFQDSTPVKLIYGVNRAAEAVPEALLAELRAGLPQLETTLAVWQPEPGCTAFQGSSAEALAVALKAAATTPDLYVCGPPKMLDAVLAVAREAGLPPAQIFAERL